MQSCRHKGVRKFSQYKSVRIFAVTCTSQNSAFMIDVGSCSISVVFLFQFADVLQQDTFLEWLTVKQWVIYEAMLRLPDEMTYEDKYHLAMVALSEVDLINSCETKIGGKNRNFSTCTIFTLQDLLVNAVNFFMTFAYRYIVCPIIFKVYGGRD